MGSSIKLYTRNIFESGTVTVTGTPDTGFPESRLYDRAISLFWKDTVTEAKIFLVNQATALAVDFLAIQKHNFNGKDMQWQWSTDDFSADINDAVTDWNQGDNLQIIKTLDTALTKNDWRVTLASIENPLCGEIFMSYGREFDVAANPGTPVDELANVQWNRTVGGLERSAKFGSERRIREYTLLLDSTDLTAFRAAMDDLGSYSKPFYIKDRDGSYWMCRLQEVPREDPNKVDTLTITTINVIEML